MCCVHLGTEMLFFYEEMNLPILSEIGKEIRKYKRIRLFFFNGEAVNENMQTTLYRILVLAGIS